MCACGGTQPTRASLTSLLQEKYQEEVKSIQRGTAGVFVLARAEKDEMSQQLSQLGDMEASVAGRAVLLSSKGAPGLGEGGRTSEGLRGSSSGQSREAKSAWAGCPGSQSFAGPCRPRLPKQLELGSIPAQGELPGLGSRHAPGAVLSCAGLRAELAPGREGTGDRRAWGKQGPRPLPQGRALLSALTCALTCLAGPPELQAALACREGETAWPEGAWLLTSSEGYLAIK